MTDEYTEEDRVAAVCRRLYAGRYKDVRRPDRTKLWKSHSAVQGVISVAIRENAVPFFSRGRWKYIKEQHAIEFLDNYITTRINSNGTTRSPIEEKESQKDSNVSYNFVQRLIGIPKIIEALNYIADIQLRTLEQVNELNEVWKPTSRNADDTRSAGGDDQKRAG